MIASGVAFLLAIVFMVLAIYMWHEAYVAANEAANARVQAEVAREKLRPTHYGFK